MSATEMASFSKTCANITGNYFNGDVDEDEFGSGSISGHGESNFSNEALNCSSGMSGSNASDGDSDSVSIRGNLYASIVPVMLFFCVLAVVVNLTIVSSSRWCRKPMSPTLLFSISLALADAFAAFILATGLVINSLLPFVFSYRGVPNCVILVVEAFRQGGVLVTVFNLLALVMNLWIGIIRPLHYAAIMTRRTAWTIIILSWICPITMIFIYFWIVPGEGFQSPNCENYNFLKEEAYRTFFGTFFFGPLILMIFIYIHIFIIVRNSQRYQTTRQLKRNVKAVRTTMLVFGTYIIGWMPATLFSLLACNNCIYKTEHLPSVVRYSMGFITNLLVILKTLVDPVIYAARMSEIQMALKRMRYDILMTFCESCAPAAPPTPNDRGRYLNSPPARTSFHEARSMRVPSSGSRSSSQANRMIANNAAAVAANTSFLQRTGHNHHNWNHNNQPVHKQQLNNGMGTGGGGMNNDNSSSGESNGSGGSTNDISGRSFARNTQQPLINTKSSFEMVEMK